MRILLFLIMSAYMTVHAEYKEMRGTVGNGGDVVVCDQGEGKYTYEILDFYEARRELEWNYEFPSSTYWRDIALQVIEQRIEPYFKIRAERYKGWLNDFDKKTELKFVDEKLNDVPDSNHISIENNCEIKQIAIQRSDKELQFGGKRYTVQVKLWNALSEQQKAVLVLHELILRDGILVKHENSIPTRYLNSYFFSQIHKEQDPNKVFSILTKIFPEAYISEIAALPFGHRLLKEKVIFVMDKSGSNFFYDPDYSLRVKMFQSINDRYQFANYSQSACFFGNFVKSTIDATLDKDHFSNQYLTQIQEKDYDGSNLLGAIYYVEQTLLSTSYSSVGRELSRYQIILALDGPLTVGQTNLSIVLAEISKLSKIIPVKVHFVLYGNTDIEGLSDAINDLDAKVILKENIDQISF